MHCLETMYLRNVQQVGKELREAVAEGQDLLAARIVHAALEGEWEEVLEEEDHERSLHV